MYYPTRYFMQNITRWMPKDCANRPQISCKLGLEICYFIFEKIIRSNKKRAFFRKFGKIDLFISKIDENQVIINKFHADDRVKTQRRFHFYKINWPKFISINLKCFSIPAIFWIEGK